MRDCDVRAAVWARLERQHGGDPDTLMLDELGLWHGSTRIDIAVVNGTFTGYELKSDSDTLERLPVQASVYNAVLDYVLLVAGERHLDKARELVPPWWGLVSAGQKKGRPIALRTLRRARRNPSIDPVRLCSLLWRDEALAVLEQLGSARGARGRNRGVIYGRLAEALPVSALRDIVRETLKRREGWRPERGAGAQQALCGG